MISKRTKDALAAAKRRGVKLGGDRGVRPTARARKLAIEVLRERAAARAADIAPVIAELQASGATSLNAIAIGLTEKGIATARGKSAWTETQVRRVLERLRGTTSLRAIGDGLTAQGIPTEGGSTD
jgi:DNA invertase Pin-like site-specific DNA recombinase